MSIRTALTTLFLVLGFVLISSQIAHKVDAVDSPLTAPVTPPVTSPTEHFDATISGKITIKKIGWWFGHFSNRVMPAENVLVKLKNVTTHEIKTTTTNASGEYTFMVDKGWYEVTPSFSNPKPDVIAPPFHFVFLKKHDTMHVDFHAFDLP